MSVYKNVKIVDTAFEGYGVGKINGNYTVFIPFTVEGDVVDVEVIKKKKSYAFGKLLKINEKSEFREENCCPYVEKCGGCSFGFIKYSKQIEIKKKILKNFFRNFQNFKINKVIESPPSRYRFRARFRVKNGKFGFVGFKSNNFVSVNDCLICKKSLIEKIKEISKYYNSKNLTECYIVENEKDEAILNFNGSFKVFNFSKNIKGIKTTTKQYGKNILKISYNEGFFYVGFNSFSQANRFLLKDFVLNATENIENTDKVLELYAGSGFFTYKISKIASKVIAIDNSKEAISLLKLLKLKNVKTKVFNLFKKLPINEYKECSTLFLDPPRQGLTKNIIDFIKKLKFEKIIYVSCNPATLSRDLNLIKNEYKIEKFYLIDMFPNTHHIECISVLKISM